MVVMKIENVGKRYRLGTITSKSFFQGIRDRLRKQQKRSYTEAVLNDGESAETSGYVWSLQDINFTVNKGEVLGVIGKNGAGKSTLLKVLSSVTGPTTGSIKIKGRVASLLEVGTGFHPELTGKENIFLNGAIFGMTKSEIEAKLDEIVEFSGVRKYIDTPVKRYSSGMYVRLAFSIAAHLEPEIMIIDEVLAVGDSSFQRKCIAKMKDVADSGRTVIFVSHNMQSIRELCSRGILLDKGRLILDGDIESVVKCYNSGGFIDQQYGEIDAGYPRLSAHKGYINIRSIEMFSKENKPEQTHFYLDPIIVRIRIDVDQPVDDAIASVSFTDAADKRITLSSTYGEGQFQYLVLNKGSYQFDFKIHQRLQPGDYSLTVSFANSKGQPYQAILTFGKFTISNLGAVKEVKYPWDRKVGEVNARSEINYFKV